MADAEAQPHPGADAEDITPRSDFWQGVGWVLFGLAVLVGSVTMDRLENQNINPYTIPGLLPGLLGIVMLGLGVLLGIRSWRRGGRFLTGPQLATSGVMVRRLALVIGLIVVYTVVLLGRGLPFWLGATIYVTASIVLLQAPQRAAEARRLSPREVVVALAIGLASGWIITWVFQDAFLVRLP